MIPHFTRAYRAAAIIAGMRFVAFAAPALSQDIEVASGETDPILGVSDRMGAPEGGMCDVHRSGLVSIELAGPVSAGDPLTAAVDGRAVLAEAAPGETIRVGGFADQPGVAGDIIDAWLAPALLHEPAA